MADPYRTPVVPEPDAEDWLEALRNSDLGKTIRAQCAEAEDAPWERDGDGWKGSIYGFCPVQGHGSVDDVFWYFRARHDEWQFEIYPTPCGGDLPDGMLWDRCGNYNGTAHNAGWMRFSEAWELIERQIACYRRERARRTKAVTPMGEPRCVLLGMGEHGPDGETATRTTWCGRVLSSPRAEWLFQEPTHVLLAIKQGMMVTPCRKCLQAMAQVIATELAE